MFELLPLCLCDACDHVLELSFLLSLISLLLRPIFVQQHVSERTRLTHALPDFDAPDLDPCRNRDKYDH